MYSFSPAAFRQNHRRANFFQKERNFFLLLQVFKFFFKCSASKHVACRGHSLTSHIHQRQTLSLRERESFLAALADRDSAATQARLRNHQPQSRAGSQATLGQMLPIYEASRASPQPRAGPRVCLRTEEERVKSCRSQIPACSTRPLFNSGHWKCCVCCWFWAHPTSPNHFSLL